MSSDATDIDHGLERAQALVELRRYDEACSLLGKLLGTEPHNAAAWCLLSQARGGVGDAKAALDAAERAASLAPGEDWPHRLRSIAMQELGDDDGAVSAARAAVAVAPQNWQTHSRLAIALSLTKQEPTEALGAAELGVTLAPNEPTTHYALGVANHRRGKNGEAERCFRQALELNPQHIPSHNALAAMQLAGSRFGRAGNLAGAAAGFRDAVQADPRSSESARNLELVLQVFIARVSYLVFAIVWIASRVTGGTPGARLVPLVLLAVPATFAGRFLSRLAPDLRRRVGYVAFHGRLAAPSYAQALAILLLLVASAAPAGARTRIGIAAVITSFAARLLLARSLGGLRFSITSRRMIVGAVGVIALYFTGALLGGGFNPLRGLAFVLVGALLTLSYYLLKLFRRGRGSVEHWM